MYMVEKSGKLLCRIVLIMLLFVRKQSKIGS